MDGVDETENLLFVLDDLGCNGSEYNLLECLPTHNCNIGSNRKEFAGVSCSRKGGADYYTSVCITQINFLSECKGVSLEFGPKFLKNNTLISTNKIGEKQEALFCSTDRNLCCNNSIDGNWYLPNGSMITNQQVIDSNHTFYVIWDFQTVGLNYMNSNNPNSLPIGIYHCEMVDENNTVNHLYVGIYPQDEG